MKYAWFGPDPFHRVTQRVPQMREIDAAHVTQLDPLELLPQALARIEVGGIGRQALHVQPLGRAIGEELLDDLTAVDRGALPHDHQAAGDLAPQVLQNVHDSGRVPRVVLPMAVEFACG